MGRQPIVLARRSGRRLLPGGLDLVLPLQAAQQGVDGALSGRQGLPPLEGGHEVYDLAVLLTLTASVTLLVIGIRMRLSWPLLVYSAVVLITVWASDGQIHSRIRLLLPAFPLLVPVAVGLARRRTGTDPSSSTPAREGRAAR